MLKFSGLGLIALVVACTPRVDDTQTARTQMIGMPKAELLQCAGEPTRDAYSAAKETLTYVRTEKHGDAVLTCQADFMVYRGHVDHVTYVGLKKHPSGPPSPCLNIVKACIK